MLDVLQQKEWQKEKKEGNVCGFGLLFGWAYLEQHPKNS